MGDRNLNLVLGREEHWILAIRVHREGECRFPCPCSATATDAIVEEREVRRRLGRENGGFIRGGGWVWVFLAGKEGRGRGIVSGSLYQLRGILLGGSVSGENQKSSLIKVGIF